MTGRWGSAWEQLQRQAQAQAEFNRHADFMARDFGRWQHKAKHPMSYAATADDRLGAINLTKGNDGVWR